MKTNMKLFIWTGFCPDYTSGLAFALAKNRDDAEQQIEKALGYPPYEWGTLEIKRLDRRAAGCVTGGG